MGDLRTCKNHGTQFAPPHCPECRKETMRKYRASNKKTRSEYLKAWRHSNPERTKEVASEWRARNGDKCKSMSSAWHAKNREKANARSSKWHTKNLEKARKLSRDWKAKNPDNLRVHYQNRRARKANNGGELSKGIASKLFKLQRGACPVCSCHLGDGYHIDHVMPFALGGKNDDSNVQLLCARCNFTKHKKHPIDFMQSRGFLL